MDLQVILAKIKQYPFAVGAAVVTLVLAIVVFFVRAPQVETLTTQSAELESQWKVMDRNLREGIGLPEDLEQAEAHLAEVEARSIEADELAANLQYFYAMENRFDLSIASVSQGATVENPSLKTFSAISYPVTVQGSFAELLTFLQELEQGERIVSFQNFSLTESAQVESGELSLNVNLQLLGVQTDE